MTKICIIPARGGSKRIPGKNIKPFLGKPIIAYSIEAALSSGLFDKVMVSTDDQEIAQVAKSYGAEVPFLRSSETADDFTPVTNAILEVLETLKGMSFSYDEVCCLFATAPFMTKNHIIGTHQLLLDTDCDGAFTIQDFGFPIFRALKKNETDHLEMVWKENQNVRSQDLPKSFHDAGQLYWIKTPILLAEKTFYCKKAKGFQLKKLEAVDIDTEDDWSTAEHLYELKKGSE